MQRVLSALPRYSPTEDLVQVIEMWIRVSVSQGHRFGIVDLFLAASATENKSSLWSYDSDFRRMEALGFVTLWQP